MEQIEQVSKTIIDTTHHFYCDVCGTYIGSSQEYDDGYYPKLGEFLLSFRLPDGWYNLDKCLCDVCKQEYLENVQDQLKDLGFMKS